MFSRNGSDGRDDHGGNAGGHICSQRWQRTLQADALERLGGNKNKNISRFHRREKYWKIIQNIGHGEVNDGRVSPDRGGGEFGQRCGAA